MSALTLRPHHGMCLAFFEGKGYSDSFSAYMEQVLLRLFREDPTVRLLPKADVICSHCPNNMGGVCATAEKVDRYDRAVLEHCGLAAGDELPWSAFSKLVHDHILTAGKRPSICGNCEWNGICAKHNI